MQRHDENRSLGVAARVFFFWKGLRCIYCTSMYVCMCIENRVALIAIVEVDFYDDFGFVDRLR